MGELLKLISWLESKCSEARRLRARRALAQNRAPGTKIVAATPPCVTLTHGPRRDIRTRVARRAEVQRPSLLHRPLPSVAQLYYDAERDKL